MTSTGRQRDREMQALFELDKRLRANYAIESEIAGRSRSFELAASMMMKAPKIVDFSTEPDHVKDPYGIGVKETDDFGRQLLLARRLSENGVRFIQICHAGGGNGAWDAHDGMKTHGPLCRKQMSRHSSECVVGYSENLSVASRRAQTGTFLRVARDPSAT